MLGEPWLEPHGSHRNGATAITHEEMVRSAYEPTSISQQQSDSPQLPRCEKYSFRRKMYDDLKMQRKAWNMETPVQESTVNPNSNVKQKMLKMSFKFKNGPTSFSNPHMVKYLKCDKQTQNILDKADKFLKQQNRAKCRPRTSHRRKQYIQGQRFQPLNHMKIYKYN